jgi:hypothetical protein
MEMKIRLIAEQQQKARKNLIDRDEYWQAKVRHNFDIENGKKYK